MDQNRIGGSAKDFAGKVEGAAGDVVADAILLGRWNRELQCIRKVEDRRVGGLPLVAWPAHDPVEASAEE